jgi:hypothetical protein
MHHQILLVQAVLNLYVSNVIVQFMDVYVLANILKWIFNGSYPSIVEGEKWSNYSVIASKSNQYWAGISSEYSPSAYIEFTQLAHHWRFNQNCTIQISSWIF